jgi:hypothetical protein
MKKSIFDTPETYPVFADAARGALRLHPEIHGNNFDLELTASIVADFMADGMPGAVVMVYGREFAADVLRFVGFVDDVECLVNLREAIADCFSIRDFKGAKCSDDFNTADGNRRKDAVYMLSLVNPAPLPVVAAEVTCEKPTSPEEIHCRELLQTAYRKHGEKLPDGIFGPEYMGFGAEGPPVKFDDQAACLRWGLAGILVDTLGRDFCRHLLVEVEAAGMFDVCPYLLRAIEDGVCQWDALGYLPDDAPETNMPV